MIDRKALWILILLCLAMTAAAIWRFSLLPDWTQMPVVTPAGPRTRSSLFLFVPPLGLLFMIAIACGTNWLVSGPEEALATRQRWSKPILVGSGVMMALMHAFMIARSLGYGLGLNAEAIARAATAVIGILMVIQGNVVPKLPRTSKRIAALDLDPWQSARSRRFAGRLCVALGLAMVIAAALLPMRAVSPVILVLGLAFIGAVTWHTVKLKREPSPLP
jgi:hypothetical protein